MIDDAQALAQGKAAVEQFVRGTPLCRDCHDDPCPHFDRALDAYIELATAIARRDEHDPFNCTCCPRTGNRYEAAVDAAKARLG